MTYEERKEIIQDVIDRTLDSYPKQEEFSEELKALIIKYDGTATQKNGIRYYCETQAIKDDVSK